MVQRLMVEERFISYRRLGCMFLRSLVVCVFETYTISIMPYLVYSDGELSLTHMLFLVRFSKLDIFSKGFSFVQKRVLIQVLFGKAYYRLKTHFHKELGGGLIMVVLLVCGGTHGLIMIEAFMWRLF